MKKINEKINIALRCYDGQEALDDKVRTLINEKEGAEVKKIIIHCDDYHQLNEHQVDIFIIVDNKNGLPRKTDITNFLKKIISKTKEDKIIKRLVIIIITPAYEQGDQADFLEAGADYVLSNSFDERLFKIYLQKATEVAIARKWLQKIKEEMEILV